MTKRDRAKGLGTASSIFSPIGNEYGRKCLMQIMVPVFTQLDGGSSEFTVAVTAISSLSFLAEFCELELSPPRPGYRVVLGYPIAGKCLCHYL